MPPEFYDTVDSPASPIDFTQQRVCANQKELSEMCSTPWIPPCRGYDPNIKCWFCHLL